MIATEVIKKKRQGQVLSCEEIQFFIGGYTHGSIPDYQMSSLLMAIFLNGMNEQETIDLTQVMLNSGEQVEFKDSFPVDKHSTGGVGDKTSLILAPIVAACDVPVPMMSGRGLGHTGGTLDKLESIPGFNVFQDLDNFKKLTETHGLCFIGQTEKICPADKKIYALRDVTATVESLPLICASIMSKKIAEGIKGLVLDVKFGSGAFMKTLEDARQLAQGLISIGKGHSIKTQALLTNMNQPLGNFVGNSLEVGECLSILKREEFLGRTHTDFYDTEDLSLKLASQMISIGKNISVNEATKFATQALDSGKAFSKFEEITKIQGGQLNSLPLPTKQFKIKAKRSGYLATINAEKVGLAGIELKAGRRVVSDRINPISGIEVHKKLTNQLAAGETLFTIHTDNAALGVEEAQQILDQCYDISDTPPPKVALVADFL